ncbi:DNA polymerase LigD, polymerase domain protein [Paenibacillus curdlanolyticus YK9]|uniref:DNA polymerase LigD, polymerase domain protein n=1 Tax=Paenibacillus curdlanolyticus YK9 TaxID=717606 RepID=E0I782_9BACL|nr:non-homologous end-joining DNA ligase [Paenibacillus curdlanolyticus]EFM11898.1 DNA polymerase LigD, polymerase domain protein [Paenibacillus curdlanolyticus YK9]
MCASRKGTLTVDGEQVVISNPTKLLWPELGITKLMYLEKLIALSPYLLPHCRERYLTTIRWPDGVHGQSFYQKNCPEPTPAYVRTAEQGDIRYVRLDSLPTLLWLGNLACLEFHASFDRIGQPDYPSEWVIDLDPSLEEEPRIMEAAVLVGDLLQSIGVQSVPKTSGATGVQLIVPSAGDVSFDELRAIGLFVGTYLTQVHPELFTIERLKANRGDRIYIDYLQHYAGKTIAAPYTPRARMGATVSTPLTWEEIKGGARIADFNLLTIEERLSSRGDLLQAAKAQPLRPIYDFVSRSKTVQ